MLNKILKRIIDVRMKNKLNEKINDILNKNGTIRIMKNITIKNNDQKLIIKNKKNHIIYIYKDQEITEKYEILKLKKDYISEYMTENKKQISIFKEKQEIIKHIEQNNIENTYIRTKNNNIILIERTKDYNKYYIGLNEKKYEDYIPENSIFSEIDYEDYTNIISNKTDETELLKKYSMQEKILHLQ